MTQEEKAELYNAYNIIDELYPMLSEENKKALDIALDLINEKLNNG